MALTKQEITRRQRFRRMDRAETRLRKSGFRYIAGFDEAGRGPLAGPVCAAAVILDPGQKIYGLNDSKKLSAKTREYLAEEIRAKALAWAVVMRDPEYIDRYNILEATRSAMEEALHKLKPRPDFILLDCMTIRTYPQALQRSIIKGDLECNAIAAASILAKTCRDSAMTDYDLDFPGYGFSGHKGYGTREHYQALDQLGPCSIHRTTFLRKWEERFRKI